MVTNPIMLEVSPRGNKNNPFSHSRLRILSCETGSAIPSRVSPHFLHTQKAALIWNVCTHIRHIESNRVQYPTAPLLPKSVLSFSFLFCFRERVGNCLAIPIQIHQIRGTTLGSILFLKNLSLIFLQPCFSYERAVTVWWPMLLVVS